MCEPASNASQCASHAIHASQGASHASHRFNVKNNQIMDIISVRGGGAAAPQSGKKIVLFGQN